MRVLIDMNLSPAWVDFLKSADIQAVHWSTVGKPNAPDIAIMTWAKANGHIVFTHDLDFGALLAVTQAEAPSVLQVRVQDTFTSALGGTVLSALQQFQKELAAGALGMRIK